MNALPFVSAPGHGQGSGLLIETVMTVSGGGVCSVECCEMFSDGKFPAFLLITGISAPEGLEDLLTIRTVSSDFSDWDLINDGVVGAEKHLS